MSDPFIGEIRAFGFNFNPRGWAQCDGQLLPISQNTALFSLLGTTYGGDGRTTFGLPDLRGRTPMHAGTGPGLSTRQIGQRSGTETSQLTVSEMPAHSHAISIPASNEDKDTNRPGGSVPARGGSYAGESDGSTLAAPTVATTGGGQAFSNLPPYLVTNYCIALTGIYPSRN